jgi:2-polyprenyl-3-methyl-5-hydroxy-6-metoxy-1,4-benzoquinol methylase
MISKRFKNDSRTLLHLNNVQLAAKNEVEKKILNGIYKFETITCPICGTTETELLSEKDRYGLDYRVVICKTCGLIYTNPRMTQKSYNLFYDSEYRKLYVGNEVPTNSFFEGQYHKGKNIFNFIKSTFPNKELAGLNVLEVGCGAGGILYYFKQQGCIELGIDLGKEYLDFGRKFDLNLKQGSLNEKLDFTPDIVIYSHVLEHILDLELELLKLKEISHKDTIFYIEVPGILNIHNAHKMDLLLYLQNAHTFYFTLTSLTNLFEKYGFCLIRGTEHIKSIFSIADVEKEENEYSCEYPAVVEYLKKIEQKRYQLPFKLIIIKNRLILLIVNLLKTLKLFYPLKNLLDKTLPNVYTK